MFEITIHQDISPSARFIITEAAIIAALYRGLEQLAEAEAEAAAELAEEGKKTTAINCHCTVLVFSLPPWAALVLSVVGRGTACPTTPAGHCRTQHRGTQCLLLPSFDIFVTFALCLKTGAPLSPEEELDEDFLSVKEERLSWDPEAAVGALLTALNALRASPKKWAKEVLLPLRQYYHSRLFDSGDGPGERRMTIEGIAALEDAIRFCKQVRGP